MRSASDVVIMNALNGPGCILYMCKLTTQSKCVIPDKSLPNPYLIIQMRPSSFQASSFFFTFDFCASLDFTFRYLLI